VKPEAAPGEHRFAVRAIDRAGNVGAAAAHTWSVAAPATPPAAGPRPLAPQPAAIAARAGRRTVSSRRTVEIATVTCPAGATCAISVPRTATLRIAGKGYTVAVTRTGTRVGLKLTRTAFARLKGRTGRVTVRVGATATGAATTTLAVNATLRR
jgi:hypothetical protein